MCIFAFQAMHYLVFAVFTTYKGNEGDNWYYYIFNHEISGLMEKKGYLHRLLFSHCEYNKWL